MSYGAGVFYIFTTAIHTGILGALLTFARRSGIPAYAATAPLWGLTPLEDQQIGGLIMWVPAGVVYLVAGLALFAPGCATASARSAAMLGCSRAARVVYSPRATSHCRWPGAVCARRVTGGDAQRGAAAIFKYGCGSCHTISGHLERARTRRPAAHRHWRANVRRGHAAKHTRNIVHWIQDPKAVDNKTAMPTLGVTPAGCDRHRRISLFNK